MAQTAPWTPPQNVLQLSATGTVEVQQDLLSMTLSTTRDAADAATVQTQLKTALDAALTEARKNAQPGQLDVRTGNFSLVAALHARRQDHRLAGHDRAGAGRHGLPAHHADGRSHLHADGRQHRLRPEPRAARQGRRPRRRRSRSTTSSRRPANWPRASASAATRLREVSVNANQGGADPAAHDGDGGHRRR